MRLCLKVGRQGYNWLFLTTFDYTIIFHLKNYLPCLVSLFSAQPHMCDCTVIFFILTYCINTMDLKSENNIKSE